MIIGAGPGIGQAVAEKFGREGWSVVLTGRNTSRLGSLVTALAAQGIKAHAVAADATDPIVLRAAIAEADRLVGGLTAIHFNAAVVRHQDLFSMTDEEVTGDLAINVAGGLHTIRAAVSQFEGRSGTIVVTGGGLAITPHEDWASIGVGKAALRNIVQALAEPLAKRGIRIAIATVSTLVAPGSAEARGAADSFWDLATASTAKVEAVYPAAPGN